MLLRLLSAQVLMPALFTTAAMAGPMVCTTTLEAPDLSLSQSAVPVTLTTCVPIETTAERTERVNYSWTAPYARGIDVVHQITDVLGLAVAGPEGNHFMGFGFRDQTLIWDASAVGNMTRALWEEQSPSLPMRTLDLPNGFDSSLAFEMQQAESFITQAADLPLQNSVNASPSPVQTLW